MGINVDKAPDSEPDPEDVLSRMRTAGVQLTPENYHVWFEYVRGENSQLVSQVERIRAAGELFTKEINKIKWGTALFGRLLSLHLNISQNL